MKRWHFFFFLLSSLSLIISSLFCFTWIGTKFWLICGAICQAQLGVQKSHGRDSFAAYFKRFQAEDGYAMIQIQSDTMDTWIFDLSWSLYLILCGPLIVVNCSLAWSDRYLLLLVNQCRQSPDICLMDIPIRKLLYTLQNFEQLIVIRSSTLQATYCWAPHLKRMPQRFLNFFGIFHCASEKIELQTFEIQSVIEVDPLGFEMCPEPMSNSAFSCRLIEPRF